MVWFMRWLLVEYLDGYGAEKFGIRKRFNMAISQKDYLSNVGLR